MNRIEEMIREMCPEGVERVKIKNVFTRLKGTPITANMMKEIENENGDILIYAGGRTIISALEKDIPKANVIRVPSVIVQSRGVIDVQYCHQPFTFKNEMWAYTSENIITTKYLYYILKINVPMLRKRASEHGSLPQISLTATEDMHIPLPPLPIQQEIVNILDKITSLQQNLEEELKLRQKQYEYYREKMLTFEEGECEWKKLGECSSLVTKQTGFDYSNTIKPALLDYKDKDAVPFLQTRNFTGKAFDYNTEFYVPKEIVEAYPKITLDKKCILFSIVGASIGNIGLFPATEKCFLGGAICVVKLLEDVNIDYIYYFMQSWNGQKQIREKTKGAGQATVTVEDIRNFVIGFPSVHKQSQIVQTLDRFESLISNIKTEIELRKKQYEYYREKLLTF